MNIRYRNRFKAVHVGSFGHGYKGGPRISPKDNVRIMKYIKSFADTSKLFNTFPLMTAAEAKKWETVKSYTGPTNRHTKQRQAFVRNLYE